MNGRVRGLAGKERSRLLLLGPAAGVLFGCGISLLALMLPGYSHVRQTVSEIGEVGSPANVPFTVLMCAVALCVLGFAWGVRQASVSSGHNQLAAYLIACLAVSGAGVGIFSFPHPLHNLFGESELIGYQAPLALALAWRRDSRTPRLVRFSCIMFVLIWVSLALNLTSIGRHSQLWAQLQPVYGLIQRSLFVAWFAWATGAGLLLWRALGGRT